MKNFTLTVMFFLSCSIGNATVINYDVTLYDPMSDVNGNNKIYHGNMQLETEGESVLQDDETYGMDWIITRFLLVTDVYTFDAHGQYHSDWNSTEITLTSKDGIYDYEIFLSDELQSYNYDVPQSNFTSYYFAGFSPYYSTEMQMSFSRSTTPPVPEPATMLLFGIGLAGVVGSGLKKKKKQ